MEFTAPNAGPHFQVWSELASCPANAHFFSLHCYNTCRWRINLRSGVWQKQSGSVLLKRSNPSIPPTWTSSQSPGSSQHSPLASRLFALTLHQLLYRASMDCNFMTFHEAMFSRASGMEPMQLFTAIQKNNNLATPKQTSGGHEVVTSMLLPEIPSEANLSSAQGTQAIPEGEVARLPDSVNVGDAVEFLLSFLEQEIPISPSPSQNQIWVKKMFHKIAQELKVLSPGNPSIIRNDDFDIMSDWKSYVEELIKELRIVQRRCSLDIRNSGVYVFTKTPYALILEMIAENLIS